MNAEELVLSGDKLYQAGTYDSSFIRLKYELSDDVRMEIPINANIVACDITAFKFKFAKMQVEYNLC